MNPDICAFVGLMRELNQYVESSGTISSEEHDIVTTDLPDYSLSDIHHKGDGECKRTEPLERVPITMGFGQCARVT